MNRKETENSSLFVSVMTIQKGIHRTYEKGQD